jgi:hypothetical protein
MTLKSLALIGSLSLATVTFNAIPARALGIVDICRSAIIHRVEIPAPPLSDCLVLLNPDGSPKDIALQLEPDRPLGASSGHRFILRT